MFHYFNPNPRGLHVGDCTVRSICAVSGQSWADVHRLQCDLSRWLGDMPSADRVWWTFLRLLGFEQWGLLDACPDACYTVADFAADHPTGIYVLGPPEHAVAVIDGAYWDSWDSGRTVPAYFFARPAP